MQISKQKKHHVFTLKLVALLVVIAILSNVNFMISDRFLKHGFRYSYEDKLNILQNTESPKTIFVGGSSVLFGIIAEQYSQLSSSPAVNMGLNAGADDVYISSIIPYSNPGDKVVLALEFEAYTSDWYSFNEIALDVAHMSKGYFKQLPLTQKPAYIIKQCLNSYNKIFDVLFSFVQSKFDTDGQIYLRKNVNKYGDFNSSIPVGTKKISPSNIKTEINHKAIDNILRYINILEEKNVDVYIIYPPCYASNDLESLYVFDNLLREKFGDRIISNIEDWTLKTNDLFFDTEYHLNNDGAKKHTEYVFHLINNN